GVSDDAELERVGDVELLGDKFSAPGDGHPIAVAWMKGRSRAYDVPGRTPASTLAIAFNDRCDVIVATAVVPDGPAARVEPAVLGFRHTHTLAHRPAQVLALDIAPWAKAPARPVRVRNRVQGDCGHADTGA